MYCVVIALVAAFLLSLMVKWGWLEYLQVHAPCDFLYKLFMCKFCCSFHASMIISLLLCLATGHYILLAAPMCTTIITRNLW